MKIRFLLAVLFLLTYYVAAPVFAAQEWRPSPLTPQEQADMGGPPVSFPDTQMDVDTGDRVSNYPPYHVPDPS